MIGKYKKNLKSNFQLLEPLYNIINGVGLKTIAKPAHFTLPNKIRSPLNPRQDFPFHLRTQKP